MFTVALHGAEAWSPGITVTTKQLGNKQITGLEPFLAGGRCVPMALILLSGGKHQGRG